MKILRILLLSIIFSTVAIGQSLQMLDSLRNGKPISKYVTPINPLPVAGNITVTGGATDYLHPANKFPSVTIVKDTVTTGTDSLTISTYLSAPTIWATFSLRNVSTDGTILQMSLSRTFAGSRLIHPGNSGDFAFFDPIVYSKIYIKKYSGTNGYYEFTGEGF